MMLRNRTLHWVLIAVLLFAGVVAPAAAQEPVRPIEYSQTAEGNLSADSPSVLYRFRGQQGDVIAVDMVATSIESYVALLGSEDYEIAWDDGSAYPNAHIGPFVLPTTGDYQIRASSLSGADAGSFTLRLTRLQIQPLPFGGTAEGELNDRVNMLYFGFEGKAGDVVDVTVVSDGVLDTRLRIRGSDSYDLAYNDDSGGNYNPEIRHFILPGDGRYIVIVEPYAPGLSGKVSVGLTLGELLSLDEGAQTLSLGDKRPQDAVTFTGKAGQQVRVRVTVVSGLTDYLTIYANQGGTDISSVSGSNLTELTFAFAVPDDGRVHVRLESYSNVVLEVALEAVE